MRRVGRSRQIQNKKCDRNREHSVDESVESPWSQRRSPTLSLGKSNRPDRMLDPVESDRARFGLPSNQGVTTALSSVAVRWTRRSTRYRRHLLRAAADRYGRKSLRTSGRTSSSLPWKERIPGSRRFGVATTALGATASTGRFGLPAPHQVATETKSAAGWPIHCTMRMASSMSVANFALRRAVSR